MLNRSTKPILLASEMSDSGAEVWSRYRLEAIMFRLARRHAEKAEEYARKYSESHDRLDLEREMEHSLQAIILSHAFLESYLNFIGEERLGGSPNISDQILWEAILKLRPNFMSKWSLVVKAVTKKRLEDEDNELWKKLNGLNDLRNKIIHYKPKPSEGVESWEEKNIRSENAKMAVSIAEQVVRKFHELDESKPPDFLKTLKAGKHHILILGGSPRSDERDKGRRS